VKLAVSPAVIVAFVQTVEPASPTVGRVQLKPDEPSSVKETNVVFGIVLSVKETFVPASGP